MPRGGGLLITKHPDVAPVKAGMFSNFAKKLYRLKSSHMVTFGSHYFPLQSEAEIVSYYFCFLGKKNCILEFVTLFYRVF